MALCLLQINQCAYSNCGQYFANQYELIAHVEFQHIPLLEEEMKKKALAASANGDERASTTAPPNVPLSIISRVFRTAYRPNPIKYEGIKVSFNHYKKRALRERMEQQKQQLQQLRAQINPDDDKKVGEIDFEECQPSDPEMRFRCGATECTKRYKNIYALKVHMKSAHQLILGDSYEHSSAQNQGSNHQHRQESPIHPPQNQSPAYSTSSGALAPGSPAQTLPSPSKPHKCSYCSKRYKTPVGLTNHLMQAHQKSTPGPDAPSQEVVNQLISQARAQGQQERMAQQAQSAQPQNQHSAQNAPAPPPPTRQLTLPVSVNMSNTSLQSQNSSGISHVSRSFTVTTTNQPLRLSQNYGPATLTPHGATTTGQMLMQQQRRIQQQQQQQAAAAAANSQQYQSPQHHQQQYTMSPVRMHPQQHQMQTPPRPQIAAGPGPQQHQPTVSSQPQSTVQQSTVHQNVQNAPQ
ncbi:unnamed protein product [Caenorhabditis angaria]|uniref:C2H2-type domain-containing protein n=1 Tax=Caenorhabditis angaria TaxID=860376 RepID=A0A9P1IKI6_9PELO|nr:unnamed protein product [Caenorhabditis angaria]